MHMSVPPLSASGEQLGERMIDLLPRLRRLARAVVEPAGHDDESAGIRAADDGVQTCLESSLQADVPWHDQRAFENHLFALLARACTACARTAATDHPRGALAG